MGEYFRGWKRKSGVLILLLVLPAMVEWVRSYSSHDYIGVCFENSEYRCGSFLGYFSLGRFTHPDATLIGGWKCEAVDWGTGPLKSLSGLEIDDNGRVHLNEAKFWDENSDSCRVTARWDYSRIHFSKCKLQGDLQRSSYTAPYGFLVIPLTVLSAWLIVSRRSRRTAHTNAESPA